jgi:hypothetical protein
MGFVDESWTELAQAGVKCCALELSVLNFKLYQIVIYRSLKV